MAPSLGHRGRDMSQISGSHQFIFDSSAMSTPGSSQRKELSYRNAFTAPDLEQVSGQAVCSTTTSRTIVVRYAPVIHFPYEEVGATSQISTISM